MDTLLLDQTLWDLCVDASGNIAVASEPYSLAQDAASAIRLFQGELYYNTIAGVPYFRDIFDKAPQLELVKAQFERAALTVPGVTAAAVFITGLVKRRLTGTVNITSASGQTASASF